MATKNAATSLLQILKDLDDITLKHGETRWHGSVGTKPKFLAICIKCEFGSFKSEIGPHSFWRAFWAALKSRGINVEAVQTAISDKQSAAGSGSCHGYASDDILALIAGQLDAG